MGVAITFLTNDDDEVMYADLSPEFFWLFCWLFSHQVRSQTRLVPLWSEFARSTDYLSTEITKSPVSKLSIELAKHEAAQHKVSREMKRKRDAEDQE